jgi:hypothetical protein
VVGLLATTEVGEGVYGCGLACEALLTCCVFYVTVLHLISGHWANADQWVLKVGAHLQQEVLIRNVS